MLEVVFLFCLALFCSFFFLLVDPPPVQSSYLTPIFCKSAPFLIIVPQHSSPEVYLFDFMQFLGVRLLLMYLLLFLHSNPPEQMCFLFSSLY